MPARHRPSEPDIRADSPAERAPAILTIDLDAIVANWRALGARLAPGCQAAAVVKADAYGLGATRVAPALAAADCRHFFVATPDEGLTLRPFLAQASLYVLSGVDQATAALFAERGLIPVLNHLGQIATWAAEARRRARRLPALLHLDTGMNRLGLSAAEVATLAAEPSLLAGIDVQYVMSHLVASEQADNPLNETQRRRFDQARASLAGVLGERPASLANSSGIFLGQPYHYALVRPGVALYGANPLQGQPNPMTEVVRLQGRILQVRHVDRGESVGYGASHLMVRPGRIATVAVGYADGYPRSASGRARALIAGVQVPQVGRVSMDMTTFDVTDIPAEGARPGAFLTLIGGPYSLDHLAEDSGTIAYEILTRLGARYARHYSGGPTP